MATNLRPCAGGVTMTEQHFYISEKKIEELKEAERFIRRYAADVMRELKEPLWPTSTQ